MGKIGERRLSCVSEFTFRGATGALPPGWKGRQLGGIPPTNQNLSKVGNLRG